MRDVQQFLMELDQLKSVYRRAYLSDQSRHENSAEHSWHLAMALMVLDEAMDLDIDVDHAVRLALAHDVCEIGPGDVSIYSPERAAKPAAEAAYIAGMAERHGGFARRIQELWQDFESQETPESRWVKVVDRLLPFLMNLATEGKTWKEQDICRSQVTEVCQVVAQRSPQMWQWMAAQIDTAVERGWLRPE